ncbi:hydroxysteroid dehydrogenase-like protein 1 [Condylostylus longicornis]|uniref:hydroxysteroid dehydrogenase-like protein 1 n=1 Tax=Condylostylus longicornis TaxID=2530218 RepID=UPI00244DD959|nr:hydroxysteroid dehydrogenase-like protein 1 [Condylostylus longicornis]
MSIELINFVLFIGAATISFYIYYNFKSFFSIIISLFKEYVYPKEKICLKERYGNWAVITGSTDGIGKAYSKELAKNGLNIVLISRSKEKLVETSKEIESEYNVQCKYIEADFSHGWNIYDHIKKQLDGIEIGILVNNVGQAYDFPEKLHNISEEKIWNMILLNIGATAMMTRLVIIQMIKRNRGLIVNLGSLCQYCPGPLNNMYAAGKAFVKSFTKSLQWELKNYNIEVQLLNPGFIRTNMTKFSKNLTQTGFFVADVNDFAKSAIWTLGRTNETTGLFYHGIQFALYNAFPEIIQTFFCQILAKIWQIENLRKKSKA